MVRLLFVVLLVAMTAHMGCSHRGMGLQIGDRVPPMTLMDVEGKTVPLLQIIKGKVALVRFWSVDCSLCKNEMILSLDALYQKYRKRGYTTVAIHEGRPVETDERLRSFYLVTYPMLIDANGTTAKHFGVDALPMTFILDEEGIVRERIAGEPGIDALERLMTGVLYKEGFYDSVY